MVGIGCFLLSVVRMPEEDTPSDECSLATLTGGCCGSNHAYAYLFPLREERSKARRRRALKPSQKNPQSFHTVTILLTCKIIFRISFHTQANPNLVHRIKLHTAYTMGFLQALLGLLKGIKKSAPSRSESHPLTKHKNRPSPSSLSSSWCLWSCPWALATSACDPLPFSYSNSHLLCQITCSLTRGISASLLQKA